MKKNRRWVGKRAIKVKSYRTSPMAKERRVRKMVIHNEGADRDGRGNVDWLARYVRDKAVEYHLIVNMETGEAAQLLPFDSAARAMLNGGINGGIGCNRSGDVCIQVCVIGYGHKPFTAGRLKAAELLGDICDSWGIPHRFRNPRGGRSVEAWNRSGIHYHSTAPGNDHTDPGPIDVKKLEKAMWPHKHRRHRR